MDERVSGVNFTATVTNPLSISGTVTNGGGAYLGLERDGLCNRDSGRFRQLPFSWLLGGKLRDDASGCRMRSSRPGAQSVSSPLPARPESTSPHRLAIVSLSGSLPTTPAVMDSNDATPVEFGMRFRSDAAEPVVGVRFYKAATNTGTHVGHLWSKHWHTSGHCDL